MLAGDVEAIVVTRYDRVRAGGSSLTRMHQEDFCQALGVSPDMKYQYQGGPTPEDIAGLLGRVDRAGTPMRERFLDMLVFQWLIVGNDAHAKNYSLLLSGGDCLLAPLYDACSWLLYRGTDPIPRLRTAMKIGRDYRLGSADRPNAMTRTAKRLGLPQESTIERFESLAAAMPDALDDAIRDLPDSIAGLQIVGRYAIEQRRRAKQCEQVANTASKMVRSHLHGTIRGDDIAGRGIQPLVQDLSSSARSSRSQRSKRSRSRCAHIGKRSHRQCTRPTGHTGKHRYS